MKKSQTQVLIIGAGPAGLSAAIELKRLGVKQVSLVERDPVTGGMPRFCHHTGFGLRDLHRPYTGPSYAKTYTAKALAVGVEIHTNTTVIDWTGPLSCMTTSPAGLQEIQAESILLATGCRERPRASRLVAGTRPQGIFTTGSLQDFVHGLGSAVGKKAVVVGAELVSLSALLTLSQARCKVVSMVTDLGLHQFSGIYKPIKLLFVDLWSRVPIITNSTIQQIFGHHRVEAVEVKNLKTGQLQTIPCDTLVFTGDWIPDHELARRGAIEMDGLTRGPAIDPWLATSQQGIFAAGNLLRGAETADVAAGEGVVAARSIHRYLSGSATLTGRLSIKPEPLIKWISPNMISNEQNLATAGKFRFRVCEFCKQAKVLVQQGSTILHQQYFRICVPNNTYTLDANRFAHADLHGDAVRVSLTAGNLE
jgi:thioredoxin reductase